MNVDPLDDLFRPVPMDGRTVAQAPGQGADVVREHRVVQTVRESYRPIPIPTERPALTDLAAPPVRRAVATVWQLVSGLLAVVGAVTVVLLAVRVWGWLA